MNLKYKLRISSSETQKVTLEFLEQHIKFGDGVKTPMSKTCDNTLVFAEGFCRKNKLDYPWIKLVLESTAGDCDCKILLNSTEMLNPDDEIGTPNKEALIQHVKILEDLIREKSSKN